MSYCTFKFPFEVELQHSIWSGRYGEPGSKELDVFGEPREPRDDVLTESGSPTSPAYGELLDVMSQAVHWLSLPWSCEK